MEYLFYIQGVHAVRVELDSDGEWDEVERYDLEKRDFVSDWRMVKRINDDMDCQKVSPIRFWEYIALLNVNIKPKYEKYKFKRKEYEYFIQGIYAIRVKLDDKEKPVFCERYDHYEKGFIKYETVPNQLYEPLLCTKVSVTHFWKFIAKCKYNKFSLN